VLDEFQTGPDFVLNIIERTGDIGRKGVKPGTLKLVGTNEEDVCELTKLLNNYDEYQRMSKASTPYSDGNALKLIVGEILYRFGYRPDKLLPFHEHKTSSACYERSSFC